MARFYDTMNDSDLKRMELLLTQGGIGYSLRILDERPAVKEILVAEEDLAAAEGLLAGAAGQKSELAAGEME